MRKLNTSDEFAVARVVRASGTRQELTQLINRAAEEKMDAQTAGLEGFFIVAEALAEKRSETAIYEALAGPFECTPGEVATMPVDVLLKGFAELAAGCDLKNFFGCVSGILKKN